MLLGAAQTGVRQGPAGQLQNAKARGRKKRKLPPATPSGSRQTGRAKRSRQAKRYADIAYSEAELSEEGQVWKALHLLM